LSAPKQSTEARETGPFLLGATERLTSGESEETMIYATNVERHWGTTGKGENRNTLYTLFRFKTDIDIPELGYDAGDVIDEYRATVSDPNLLGKIVNDWVSAITAKIQARLDWLKQPENIGGQAFDVDLSAFQAKPAELSAEQISLQTAQRDYQQKRRFLIQAKQDLEIGLVTQEDFAAIQTDAVAAKATAETAKVSVTTEKITG
jgi:hypothetical protein